MRIMIHHNYLLLPCYTAGPGFDKCFLTTAEDVSSSGVPHSSAVSDGATDDGIVHTGCQHSQSVLTSSGGVLKITWDQSELLLSGMPDGTFLVREKSGIPIRLPSSESINTHTLSYV